jgi:hypothetical protein
MYNHQALYLLEMLENIDQDMTNEINHNRLAELFLHQFQLMIVDIESNWDYNHYLVTMKHMNGQYIGNDH